VNNLLPRCRLILNFVSWEKFYLIDSMFSSVVVTSWSNFGKLYDLSLGKLSHLTRYLLYSVNGNMGCPVIKRDRIHCVLKKGAMLFCEAFSRFLAAKMRIVDIFWISLRFPCATIFYYYIYYNYILNIIIIIF